MTTTKTANCQMLAVSANSNSLSVRLAKTMAV